MIHFHVWCHRWDMASLVFGWRARSCGGSSLTLIITTCTRIIVLDPTFSCLMRNLCLSSALLWETYGAASNPHPFTLTGERRCSSCGKDRSIGRSVSHSVSPVFLSAPLFSLPNIKRVVWRGKTSCYDDDGHMVKLGHLIWLTRPRCFCKTLTLSHIHTHNLPALRAAGPSGSCTWKGWM